mmetsp:Transcript_111157/g.175603  ORF Transcript_111157/g.175603 Transcript_111157/m.175603 type:complete len:109 (+) Transcript_111157:500-826(+)
MSPIGEPPAPRLMTGDETVLFDRLNSGVDHDAEVFDSCGNFLRLASDLVPEGYDHDEVVVAALSIERVRNSGRPCKPISALFLRRCCHLFAGATATPTVGAVATPRIF